MLPPPTSTLFPYTTLFRSPGTHPCHRRDVDLRRAQPRQEAGQRSDPKINVTRSEEHTSELQSPDQLVCRLLLEKKKTNVTRLRNQYNNRSTTITDTTAIRD